MSASPASSSSPRTPGSQAGASEPIHRTGWLLDRRPEVRGAAPSRLPAVEAAELGTSRPLGRRGRLPIGLPALLSITQAARLLGVGRSTLYEGIRAGRSDLAVVRVGKQWRVPRVAVELILAGGRPDNVPHPALPAVSTSETAVRSCPSCGGSVPARAARTCSAARRSSSTTGSV